MRPTLFSVSTLFLGTMIGAQEPAQTVNDRLRSAEGRGHRASTIFVDSRARHSGDGGPSAPVRTIAEAIDRAREIRDDQPNRIIIRVAPGEYREDSSLYLDISNVELRGSTRLVEDENGLPRNCGSGIAPVPCVERGTETVIAPVRPLTNGQVLLLVGPTRQRAGDRLAGVTIRGFVFDGLSASVSTSGWAVFVDRVENFLVRHNVTHRVQIGIFTRLASGRIEGNFVYNGNDGVALGSGSGIYPAKLDVRANRLVNHLAQGGLALGAGGKTFMNDPILMPHQILFDPSKHPEEVPNKLDLTLVGNDISRNGGFGFRFESYASGSRYDTTNNQPASAHITATVRDNSFTDNAEYGVTIEGAFSPRGDPRAFTGTFTGVFADNDFTRSGRAGIFAGFMLNGVVTRNPGLIVTNKYLQDSRFAVTLDQKSTAFGVDYDNAILDPFDRVTPLNNTLLLNGAMVTGRRVTCPPGFPCAP